MKLRFRSLCLGVILGVVLLSAGRNTADAQAQITLRVDTVSVSPDSATVTIPVWLDNPGDTLVGFEVWFRLHRPNMIKFETTIDSLYDTLYWNCLSGIWPACIDSELVIDTSGGYDFFSEELVEVKKGGSFDTSGTLISGWQLSVVSLGGQALDMKIVGIANSLSPPFNQNLAPQSGGILLYLIATLVPMPDTMFGRTVIIEVVDAPDHTNFADQNGTTLTHEVFSGSVTILPPSCCVTAGNANGDSSGKVSITDIAFLIARIFAGGAAPPCCEEGDANGSGSVNIADVTYLIARIFAGGPAPICGPAGMGC
ncbi:MAG: dockerin type I repeat-containing protein [candidate division Zixibacteria bacterium]|nr:dockerin type I repeat-containing protein [candidate division Zixibacteria bacterium]